MTWIKTNKWLPEEDEMVYIYTTDDVVMLGWYDNLSEQWYTEHVLKIEGVTHWRPIKYPNPPIKLNYKR